MKKIIFLLLFLFALPANAFNLPQGAEILTSPSQIKDFKILGQVGTKGGFLYGVKKDAILGAYNPVTGYSSRITQFISATVTTLPVVTTNDFSGQAISLSNISSSGTVRVYFNISAGAADQELVMCTGLTATSWTNCTRGLQFQGSSEVSSTTLAKSHNAGSSIIITNIGQFYNNFVSVDGNQIINDIKTFSSLPVATSSVILCTSANQFCTKNYIDTVGAGGFTANNTSNTQGTFALGTSPETVGIKASSTQGAIIGADGRIYQQVSTTRELVNTSTGTFINTTTLVNEIATSTPTPLKIPISDSNGTLNSWVPAATTSLPLTVNTLLDNSYFTYPLVSQVNISPAASAGFTNAWRNYAAAGGTADGSAKIGNFASTTFNAAQEYEYQLPGTSTEYASFGNGALTTTIKFKARVDMLAAGAAGTIALGVHPFSVNNNTTFNSASTTFYAALAWEWSGTAGANTGLCSYASAGAGSRSVTCSPIVQGSWNTYAISFSSNTAQFFLNGALQATVTNNLPTSSSAQFAFGSTGIDKLQFTDPIISQQQF